MKFFSEYSAWLIPLCIIIGFVLTFLLYKGDDKLSDAPKYIKRILFALRGVFVSLLLILLVGIFIESTKIEVEKPIIVVLQDNSESIVVNKDSAFYVTEYPQKLQATISSLEEQFNVHTYSFGENLSKDLQTDFSQKETNLSQVIADLSNTYYNRNVGAIVLATDGIYTQGANPIYAIENLPFATPVYSIALGDSVQAKDALVADIQTNKIAFRENPFPVKVKVQAHSLQNTQALVRIYEEKTLLATKTVAVNSNNFYVDLDYKILAKTLGKHIYRVEVEQLKGEISYENNAASFIIDVLESRQKIAIIHNHIHPDIAALRNALLFSQNIEVEVLSAKDNINISQYNCIIFHGLPNTYGVGKTVVAEATKNKIPCLFIYNTSTEFSLLAENNSGIAVRRITNDSDEVQAMVNSEFNLFKIEENTRALLQQAPPLTAPYGFYSSEAQAQTALWQSMNSIQMQRPLLVFNNKDGQKTATLTGEGIWRWRMYDNRQNGTAELFDGFINKIISYLALREKRSLFSVNTKDVYKENQDIIVSAELYNKTYEAVVDKTIKLSVFDAKNNEYTYVFTPLDKSYSANIGNFEAGVYTYKSEVESTGEKLVKTGTFIVEEIQNEYIITKANHTLLRELSINTQAQVFYPGTMQNLPDTIVANKSVTAISHRIMDRNNLINYLWLFILIALLASAEWFLRKFYSSY